ncbi:MAG: BREX-1 system adenine-specific DNA-methyltransferase PglX [Flavobacteriaceae bacterium]|nr:BREX-1 system adenine-specific DNA-methyltransferase PglX [Flavobacteriaceae bacterium]
MNTKHLKTFAQEARKKLIAEVSAKLEYVLNSDSAELREMRKVIDNLNHAIKETSKEQVIEKAAYTWFNRFIALRFMDANDYQPIGIKVLSPIGNLSIPEILYEAIRGNISYVIKEIIKNKIKNILDGRLPSSNPHNEVYKLLLIGVCNHYNEYFPFLFKQINDYTELLLPDDLNSEFSILHCMRNGMSKVDCEQVEIIGWLYQFYISERTRELISSKKKFKRDELAPASQLYTPRWIVEYMVDNTLGQIWTEISPRTKITDSLRYYIKPSCRTHLGTRKKKSIKEVTFFEPCVGSGHILSYAFDVFYRIYEKEGYTPSEIPELILKNNLYGIDIDQRATQLASFALMMKAISKDKSFIDKRVSPNISFYEDYKDDANFEYATGFGSLIKVDYKEYNSFKIDHGTIPAESQTELKKLYHLLSQKYDIVVTNPPYIRSSKMEDKLTKYVHSNYPIAKSDLFACFILRCLELCNEDGLTGYMTPFNWMFISSYEKLRKEIINKHFINNLIQLEYSGFDEATVAICTFTLRKKNTEDGLGRYIRLSDFKGSELQSPKTLEAIQNPDCGWFYRSDQKVFLRIPNSVIGYWLSDSMIEIMGNNNNSSKELFFKAGLSTGNNNRFLRRWYEVAINNSDFSVNSKKKGIERKWVPYNKGGEYRKWYGNRFFVVNWTNSGETIKNYKRSTFRNARFQFEEGGTYSNVGSKSLSARYSEDGFAFDAKGPMFFSEKRLKTVIAFLNSKVCSEMLKALCPTVSFNVGELQQLPIIVDESIDVESSIEIAKEDWNQREISWDFKRNELICINGQDLEDSYSLYRKYWRVKFFQLHKNEEDINRQFIDIYGLNNELTPDIPLDEITILKEETSIANGKLVFDQKEVLSQFISYAVGCMFGRYSLYREGLILANQGETLQDYLLKVGKKMDKLSFVPDEDNIIPILDDEWFEDDIVGRFNKFLKVCFGEHNFERNRLFVEECIGKDIRKYFVRDFYKEHIQRYKKRPIYWMFSSLKNSFNVLIYMHRYTSDTLSQLLNSYLKEYIEKLKARMETLNNTMNSSSHSEHNKAAKEKNKIQSALLELKEYYSILYTLATERISIDLDDGVLVNYNKFGKAIAPVQDLNNNKTKEKVQRFDWIDKSNIR